MPVKICFHVDKLVPVKYVKVTSFTFQFYNNLWLVLLMTKKNKEQLFKIWSNFHSFQFISAFQQTFPQQILSTDESALMIVPVACPGMLMKRSCDWQVSHYAMSSIESSTVSLTLFFFIFWLCRKSSQSPSASLSLHCYSENSNSSRTVDGIYVFFLSCLILCWK